MGSVDSRPRATGRRYRSGREPTLIGVESRPVRDAAARIDDERLHTLEECIELELDLGRAGELVGELTELTRQYPYRETFHGFLMLALYRAGRQADALSVYRRLHRLLTDELGTPPPTSTPRRRWRSPPEPSTGCTKGWR
ncbi:MAG TPA: AfsR/SARP family transcriptional regulator [Natronosporangium sp.]